MLVLKDRITQFALLSVLLLPSLSSAQANQKTIHGFAELHSHLMAEHHFGGGFLWGSNDGPEEQALHRCSGNMGGHLHATVDIPVIAEHLGSISGITTGDTGFHAHKRNGKDTRECEYIEIVQNNPLSWACGLFGGNCGPDQWTIVSIEKPWTCPTKSYHSWPSWDTIGHQQMWSGWLKEAHNRNLKVLVVSLTESKILCSRVPSFLRKYDCNEMNSIHRQLNFLNHYANNNSDWLAIARSAQEVRDIVHDVTPESPKGKLALVIAVEITELFPSGDFVAQLENFYQKGVRSIQLVHHGDSRFSGAAPLEKIIQAGTAVEAIELGNFTSIDDIKCVDSEGNLANNLLGLPKCDGINTLNKQGLTVDGEILLTEMMKRGMLIDFSHMSRKAIKDAYPIVKRFGNYPIFYSHAHLLDSMDVDYVNEKYISNEEIEMIVSTRGMVGLRTGPDKTKDMPQTSVKNNCDGSSRSFAQSLAYGIDKGLNIGFGADFQGFIQQMVPRYENEKDPERNEPCRGHWGQQWEQDDADQNTLDRYQDWFNEQGLAHVGLLPALVKDLEKVGLEQKYLEHLNSSAETFVQMWERAERLSVTQGNRTAEIRYFNSP